MCSSFHIPSFVISILHLKIHNLHYDHQAYRHPKYIISPILSLIDHITTFSLFSTFRNRWFVGSRPKRKERRFWERRHARGKRQLEGRAAHTCMEDLTTLGLGFLQCIVMDEEPETYKYRYLGLIERELREN
jgi:hypothetical protein